VSLINRLTYLLTFSDNDAFCACMQVILIYHVTPDDLQWARDSISISVPELSSMIAEAESADIVYSVSNNVYDYFKAMIT